MKKRPFTLLLASIIGILMTKFMWGYIGQYVDFSGGTATYSQDLGTELFLAMSLPFCALATVALVFCCISWLFKQRWAALVAGILYSVSIVCLIPWLWMVVVQMILCYVGFAQMKTKPERAEN